MKNKTLFLNIVFLFLIYSCVENNKIKLLNFDESKLIFKNLTNNQALFITNQIVKDENKIFALSQEQTEDRFNNYIFYILKNKNNKWEIDTQKVLFQDFFGEIEIYKNFELKTINNQLYLFFVYNYGEYGNACDCEYFKYALISLQNFNVSELLFVSVPVNKNNKIYYEGSIDNNETKISLSHFEFLKKQIINNKDFIIETDENNTSNNIKKRVNLKDYFFPSKEYLFSPFIFENIFENNRSIINEETFVKYTLNNNEVYKSIWYNSNKNDMNNNFTDKFEDKFEMDEDYIIKTYHSSPISLSNDDFKCHEVVLIQPGETIKYYDSISEDENIVTCQMGSKETKYGTYNDCLIITIHWKSINFSGCYKYYYAKKIGFIKKETLINDEVDNSFAGFYDGGELIDTFSEFSKNNE